MSLKYDFDIFTVIPDGRAADPDLDDFMVLAGMKAKPEAALVALFRDPRTARALADAPAALRDYFIASGFGLNTYDSGAPPGCYPAADEQARLQIIQRLTANALSHPLPALEAAPEGGAAFRLGEFLAALEQALPLLPPQPEAADHGAGPLPPRLPDLFETEPEPASADNAAAIAPPRRFWRSRFFRRGLAAGTVICAVAGAFHLTEGRAVLMLAQM